jgi:uncharacterized protein YndB with AHSA1/START domain
VVTEIADEVVINAPVARVWAAIQDPGEHAAWHPFATQIVGEHALGATRTCSVLIGGKPGTSQERCSAFDESARIAWTVERDSSGFSRMVSDWSSGFTLRPAGEAATKVRAESVFRPRGLLVRLMAPVVARKFHQTQRAILDGLRQHVEA